MKWVFSWVDGAQREAVILASQLSGSHPVTSSQFGVVGHSAIQTTMSCLLHLLLKKSRGRKSAWALCFDVCACMSVLTKDCESPLDYTLKLLLCECCLYLSSTYFALFVLSLSLYLSESVLAPTGLSLFLRPSVMLSLFALYVLMPMRFGLCVCSGIWLKCEHNHLWYTSSD